MDDWVDVVFVTATNQFSLQYSKGVCMSALGRDARDVKAAFIIVPDREDGRQQVFSMRGAQRNTPYPGEWSFDDPIRVFEADQCSAATMWAVAMLGRY